MLKSQRAGCERKAQTDAVNKVVGAFAAKFSSPEKRALKEMFGLDDTPGAKQHRGNPDPPLDLPMQPVPMPIPSASSAAAVAPEVPSDDEDPIGYGGGVD